LTFCPKAGTRKRDRLFVLMGQELKIRTAVSAEVVSHRH
jgi:hypothetical protein